MGGGGCRRLFERGSQFAAAEEGDGHAVAYFGGHRADGLEQQIGRFAGAEFSGEQDHAIGFGDAEAFARDAAEVRAHFFAAVERRGIDAIGSEDQPVGGNAEALEMGARMATHIKEAGAGAIEQAQGGGAAGFAYAAGGARMIGGFGA